MLFISHLLSDGDMRELVETFQVGVECIDFSIADNLDHFSETLHDYQKRMKEIGTKNLILHGPFLDLNPAAFDSRIRRVTYERFAQCYEAGRELGAQKIVYHSGMDPMVYFQEGWAERVAEFFESFLQDRTDIEVVMENVLDPMWESVKKVGEMVEAKNFGICLDMGHAHCYSKQPVLTWAKEMQEWIGHVHVHDNDGTKDAHKALGNGTIPWQEILQTLSLREGRTWSIECPNKEDAIKSIERIKAMDKMREAKL